MAVTTHAAASATDRRIARRRVGATALAAFLILLVLATTRGPAQADPVPASAPATTTTQPAQPQRSAPLDPDPGRHGRFGPSDGGGFAGGGLTT
jgi:hypothetical protein